MPEIPSPAPSISARPDSTSRQAASGRIRVPHRRDSNLLAAHPLWAPSAPLRTIKPISYRRQPDSDRIDLRPHRGHPPTCSPAAMRKTCISARRFKRIWITRRPPILKRSRAMPLPRRMPWRRSAHRAGARATKHPPSSIPLRDPSVSKTVLAQVPIPSSEPEYPIRATSGLWHKQSRKSHLACLPATAPIPKRPRPPRIKPIR